MPGVFSKQNRPNRPGSYVNFVGLTTPIIPPAPGTIVAVPFTHNWGPFETPVLLNSWQEFLAVYGGDSSAPTPGYIAVFNAFRGEGLSAAGRGGAGGVLAYRFGGSAAAKAAHTFQNTAGTPANALTVAAIYQGARGNNLKITIQDHAADSTKDELLVYENATLLETYIFTDTDVAGLAAEINNASEWITATSIVTGTALAHVTTASLTAGNDGSTLVSGDWTEVLAALATQQFGVFAPYDVTDTSIQATILAWAQTNNQSGNRFFSVFGGALDESVGTAITRGQALNDSDTVTIGVGSFVDDVFGPLSWSQMAPRIAGIIAAAGEAVSITSARLAGGVVRNGPQPTDYDRLYAAGVIATSRDFDTEAPIKLEKGITTFTTSADPRKPVAIFSRIRNVAIMHGIEAEFTTWFADWVGRGGGSVDDVGREAAVTYVTGRLTYREGQRIVQTGWSVDIDRDPPPTPQDEFIALAIAIAFGRSADQVFLTISVS